MIFLNSNDDIELGACGLLRSDHSRGHAGGMGWLKVHFGLFVGYFFSKIAWGLRWCMDEKPGQTISIKLAPTCSLVQYEVSEQVSSKCVVPKKSYLILKFIIFYLIMIFR